MSFWKFIGAWFTKAFHLSWHASHIAHQVCVLLIGFFIIRSAVLGIKTFEEEEPKTLMVAPLVAAFVIFLASLVWHAYSLYKDEFDKRALIEKRQQGEESAVHADLNRLIVEGVDLRDNILRTPQGDGAAEFETKIQDWHRRALTFVESKLPNHVGIYRSDIISATVYLGNMERSKRIQFMDRRMSRLIELQAKLPHTHNSRIPE